MATVTQSVATGDTPPDSGAQAGEMPRHRHGRVDVAVVVVYAVLALALFWPVGPFDAHRLPVGLPGDPAKVDPEQMSWFLAWFPFAVSHGLNVLHTTYIGYPHGVNLADNTSVPLLGLLGWPVTAAAGPVAAFNFLIRFAFFASATSMYFVLGRFARLRWARFAGGLLYGFGPYAISQSQHLDLLFVAIPPLLVACGDEIVRRRRMRPAAIGILTGLALVAELFISPDILSACLLLAAIMAVYLALRYRDQLSAQRAYVLRSLGWAAAIFAVIAAFPLFEMVAGPGHLTGPVVDVGALQRLQANVLGPFVPTSNQWVSPHVIARYGNHFVAANISENGSYLGLGLVAVLVFIVVKLRRVTTVATFAVLGGSSFVLSLGSHLAIGTVVTPIPMPEAALAHLPLLQDTIPARYALFVGLFASLLVAIGIDHAWHAVRSRQASWDRSKVLATAGLCLLVAVPILPRVPFASPRLRWPASLPVTLTRVVPLGGAVLTYPLASPLNANAMVWQADSRFHFHLVGGYANVQPPGAPYGQRWGVLLSPGFVEELFGQASIGGRYPSPGPITPATEALLPVFLNRYRIVALVYWPGGIRSQVVCRYIRSALGSPEVTDPHFAIWLPIGGSWHLLSAPTVKSTARS